MRHIIFGESHGPAIGVTLEGAPSGVALDWDFIRAEMARRAPGGSAMSTARKEADEVQILSGVFEGKTTGTPLCAVISNTDTRSGDYAQLKALPRPGHADYSGGVRYGRWEAGLFSQETHRSYFCVTYEDGPFASWFEIFLDLPSEEVPDWVDIPIGYGTECLRVNLKEEVVTP